MSSSIFLKEFCILANIGIHDFEYQKPQNLKISVRLDLADVEGGYGADDQINAVVDYDFIRNSIIETIAAGHIKTQEWLVHHLIDKFLYQPLVERATVSSEKTEVYPESCSVGYESSKSRKPVLN